MDDSFRIKPTKKRKAEEKCESKSGPYAESKCVKPTEPPPEKSKAEEKCESKSRPCADVWNQPSNYPRRARQKESVRASGGSRVALDVSVMLHKPVQKQDGTHEIFVFSFFQSR